MMYIKIKRITFLFAACLLACCGLAGCQPSKKKVLSSSYYKELNKKNKKLKKENEKLKAEIESKDSPTEDEKRAADYLEKIARDRLISLEIGYADNMQGGELLTDKLIFPAATMIAKRADLTTKYTPEEIEKKYGPGYEYILYDEDNAVYEILIYKGDYVVFTDLPNAVYYSYNASALGDAFLQYKHGCPDSRLLHRMSDSPLVTDGKYCYEYDSAFLAANHIRIMDKERTSRKKADKIWLKEYQKKHKTGKEKGKDQDAEKPDPSVYEPEGEIYTFYHHGDTMTLTVYDRFLCLKGMDEKEVWYQADPEDIKELKEQFQIPEEEKAADQKKNLAPETEKEQSHEKEIEEENAQ